MNIFIIIYVDKNYSYSFYLLDYYNFVSIHLWHFIIRKTIHSFIMFCRHDIQFPKRCHPFRVTKRTPTNRTMVLIWRYTQSIQQHIFLGIKFARNPWQHNIHVLTVWRWLRPPKISYRLAWTIRRNVSQPESEDTLEKKGLLIIHMYINAPIKSMSLQHGWGHMRFVMNITSWKAWVNWRKF